jgi:membrane-bound lytic murein transglycosylase MltF
MQMLPSTARDKNVGIPNIEKMDPNIHAGAKYLRFLADRYFPVENGMDAFNSAFFTFAAYNAGPARITKLRNEAEKKGLDPNIWFNNVEIIAAKRIGRETVQYVSNILKYYVAYKFLEEKL